MNKHIVLALAPYSQRLGVAILDRSELLHFKVKTFALPRTAASISVETRRELAAFMDQYHPNVLILKTLSKRQSSSENQRAVVEQIIKVANAGRIPILNVSFESVKRSVVRRSTPTDQETFAAIKELFPELRKLTNFQNRHQREYYRPLLAAVTLGFSKIATP